MFVLVSTRDDDWPDADPPKRVVALEGHEVETLIGESADELFRPIVHRAQINEAGAYRGHEVAAGTVESAR